MLADGDYNSGSCIVLASDNGGGPRPRWQLKVDPDGGTGQWLWTIVASDLDGGSWSWWLLTKDYDCSRTAWYIVFLFRYSTITDNNQFTDLQSCFKMFILINAAKTFIFLKFSFTLDIYCTSVRPGRGIPHMWLSEVSTFFLPVKRFLSSFSLLLLRVKGRGWHTLPYETNCDLWIWAIQTKFDWLIDSQKEQKRNIYSKLSLSLNDIFLRSVFKDPWTHHCVATSPT